MGPEHFKPNHNDRTYGRLVKLNAQISSLQQRKLTTFKW